VQAPAALRPRPARRCAAACAEARARRQVKQLLGRPLPRAFGPPRRVRQLAPGCGFNIVPPPLSLESPARAPAPPPQARMCMAGTRRVLACGTQRDWHRAHRSRPRRCGLGPSYYLAQRGSARAGAELRGAAPGLAAGARADHGAAAQRVRAAAAGRGRGRAGGHPAPARVAGRHRAAVWRLPLPDRRHAGAGAPPPHRLHPASQGAARSGADGRSAAGECPGWAQLQRLDGFRLSA